MTDSPWQAGEPAFEPPHPDALSLWATSHRILAVVLAAAAALAGVGFGWPAILLALVVLAVGLASAAPLARARFRARGHIVREFDVLIRSGVVVRSVTLVPHVRLQHVDVRSGPLERAYGLARVIIYTAGSAGGAVEIPGLASADALSLRDRLATLVGADQAL